MTLYYRKLAPSAYAPTKAHPGDAGWDLRSREYASIEPGRSHTFATGIAAWMDGVGHYYRRIAGRSGLAAKHGIGVLGGVVDAGYRGEIGIILINHGDRAWHAEPGMKIAQLIPERIVACDEAVEAEVVATGRGSNGFGSTGA